MVMVLPPVQRGQSFSQKLNAGVGKGLEIGSQLMGQHQRNEAMKQFAPEIAGIPEEYQKEYLQKKFADEFREKEQGRAFSNASELQKQKYGFEKDIKENAPDHKKNEEMTVRDTAQRSFDGLVDLVKKGNVGYGSGLLAMNPFAKDTQRDVGKFSSLTGGLEAMLVDQVSKGSLSNERFKYITETLLPKPGDTQEAIKGKLMGISEILGLDPSKLTGKSRGKTVEMRDKTGAVYQIPEDKVEEFNEFVRNQ
jgi:hypothetical protein